MYKLGTFSTSLKVELIIFEMPGAIYAFQDDGQIAVVLQHTKQSYGALVLVDKCVPDWLLDKDISELAHKYVSTLYEGVGSNQLFIRFA